MYNSRGTMAQIANAEWGLMQRIVWFIAGVITAVVFAAAGGFLFLVSLPWQHKAAPPRI